MPGFKFNLNPGYFIAKRVDPVRGYEQKYFSQIKGLSPIKTSNGVDTVALRGNICQYYR
jgi:hypothetical protein